MKPLRLSNGAMMSTNPADLNLLYVFADQWRAQAVGCMGEDAVSTPHMDAFAQESILCRNAVSTYPLCSPHRAALLTGRHPLSCGFWTNCKAPLDGSPFLRDDEVTIGDIAWAAGYDTAYIGKWHLSQSELNLSGHPVSGAQGWDAYTPPGKGRHGFRFWHSYGAMDDHLHPHYWENSPRQLHYDMWSPTHETDVLLEYLEQRPKDKPFMAFLSWNPPHPPYDTTEAAFQKQYEDMPMRENVPQSWKTDPVYRKARCGYFGAVSALDREFGRILDFLDKNHLRKSTIIVLSSDHGDMMGSQGLYGKNTWYDEASRIPLIIHVPRLGKGISDCLFASEDHAPTLLQLLGLEIPPAMEGVSHAGELAGGDREERTLVYHCMNPGMPDLVAAYRARGLDQKAYGWRAVRDKRYLFVVDRGIRPGMEEQIHFYDEKEDPFQMHPVSPTQEQERMYRELIREYAKRIQDPFRMEAP